ncbi:MAG TPA: hypothetical protein PLL36_01355 [Candidatus Hydrogenedentes bacterium]|nr:hypothetical protein [Candidatus Hydrogenedentota bacterium]
MRGSAVPFLTMVKDGGCAWPAAGESGDIGSVFLRGAGTSGPEGVGEIAGLRTERRPG